MNTDFLNLNNIKGSRNVPKNDRESYDNQIAIIGMSVNMPLAENLDEYWANIKNGVDCIRELPIQRQQDIIDYYNAIGNDTEGLKFLKEAYIDDVDKFDYDFFGLSPREAKLMNPHQRMFLQTVYSSIEDSGYGGDKLKGTKTGVFLGFISDLEGYKYKEMINQVDKEALSISTAGNLSSIIATRISYILDLKGPSMLIDTACSSSLVAVHNACESLKRGECDYAIAGGIKLSLMPIDSEYYKIGIESSDGFTRTFDDKADGSGMGEGVAAIILKPLKKAIEDKDNIYAVVKGSAVNQDGTSMGITAPNPLAQQELLIEAWKKSGINPNNISYIEAHGTGTSLGDPIEIDGLIGAFKKYSSQKQFCAIGSVKTNIGHLYECSGLAGLIKTVLMIKNNSIPPTIHFNKPSEKINFINTPFYISSKLKRWNTKRKICGVSSFGISGTNCHVVLEDYKHKASDELPVKDNNLFKIFTISAKSKNSLRNIIIKFKEYLDNANNIELNDLCYTVNSGRGCYNYRMAIISEDIVELRKKILEIIDCNEFSTQNDTYYYGECFLVSEEQKSISSRGMTIREKEKNNSLFDTKLKNYTISQLETKAVAEDICNNFVMGVDINWNYYYKDKKFNKISLPTYCFDKKRCWLDINTIRKVDKEVSNDILSYSIGWNKNVLSKENALNFDCCIFLRDDNTPKNSEVISQIRNKVKRVIEVTINRNFEKIDTDNYYVENNLNGYTRLLNEVMEEKLQYDIGIIYDLSDDFYNSSDCSKAIEDRLYSLLQLSKGVSQCTRIKQAYLYLITSYAYEVTGSEENIYPYNGAFIGLSKVIGLEYSNIKCKVIDIDKYTENGVIANEILSNIDYSIVSLRKSNRYIQELSELELGKKNEEDLLIKKNGVYILTGGCGGIGLEICKYLSGVEAVNIAMINRSKFPEQNEWDNIIAENKDFKLIEKIKKCKEILSLGSRLEFFSTDVSDYNALAMTINAIRSRYGKIDGVIHSAGIGSFKTIDDMEIDDLRAVTNSKINGTMFLDELTQNDSLDFFILFSSIATSFPSIGQAHYTSANAFLDSYCAYRNKVGKYTLCVNWTTWKDTGMAYDNGFNVDTIFKTLSTEKAISVFDKALRIKMKQLIIGSLNYGGSQVKLLERKGIKISESIERKLKKSAEENRKNTNINVKMEKQVFNISGNDNGKYNEVEKKLAEICSKQLGFNVINIYENFFELGADSILIKKIYEDINSEFPGVIEIVDLFEYSSINKLSEYILKEVGKLDKENDMNVGEAESSNSKNKEEGIAVIGMDINFPMAKDISEFWLNLKNGINSISDFPELRKEDIEKYLTHNKKNPQKVKFNVGAYLEEIDKFDYSFFKISPREANLMDPCQRLFIQSAWKAVEDAGYGGDKIKGSNTGVFVGYSSNIRDSYGRLFFEDDYLEPAAIVGNMQTILPNRCSYLMDIHGPSLVIDTACSSSLVAVHYACNSILSGDCDMAIAGGVRLNMLPIANESETMGIESSDGETRAFDDNSDGAGVGEGIATIVLKEASKAIRDNDHIYAIIRATAVNQDGRSNGLTSPNPYAHTELIKKAWSKAKINPETITYIETHGTGTNLGDPIEVQGIKNAFKEYTDKKQFCAIGSLKPNIGHLFEAAGIANLIKVILAINNKEIPPTINFNLPNSNINFDSSPVYVNSVLSDWRPECNIRRAGTSAFGFGGTNCHILIDEAVLDEIDEQHSEFELITMSGHSKESLRNLVNSYKYFLENSVNIPLRNVCYTANTGRGQYKYRIAIIFRNKFELISKLSNILESSFNSNNDDYVFYGENISSDRLGKDESYEYRQELEELLEKMKSNSDNSRGVIKRLAYIYSLGIDVNWNKMYEGKEIRRVSIPTYVFDKKRCWIEYNDEALQNNENSSSYYRTEWFEYPIKVKDDVEINAEGILLFNCSFFEERQIKHRLSKDNSNIYEVVLGESFCKIDDRKFAVSNNAYDYEMLLKELSDKGIGTIIHSFAIDHDYDEINDIKLLDNSQEQGVYSLFYLLKAINSSNIKRNLKIILFASKVNEVTGTEANLNPQCATLYGLGRIVSQEFPNVKCRCVDLDNETSPEQILNEIHYNENLYQVSYREGRRYAEEFKEVSLEEFGDDPTPIRENGVYIITGGTGGIGLELAKDMATKNKVNLILINRTEIPKRHNWEFVLSESRDAKLCKKIRKLIEIEGLGSTVQCFAADICNLSAMTEITNILRNKFGAINGIIHCAAVPGDGFIINKKKEVFDEVLLPKVNGTWVLDKVTAQDDLDFFILFSSGLSLLGEAGQGDYVAANSYLDAFSKQRNKKNKKTVTIDWVSWQSAGMSVEYGFNVDKLFKTITTEAALESLNYVINKNIKQVLIGELNFEGDYIYLMEEFPMKVSDKISKSIARKGQDFAKNKSHIVKNKGAVKLKGIDKNSISNICLKVANIWAEVLGIDEIHISDSFYELGGNSILAIRLLRKLQTEFTAITDLSLNDILALSTIEQLTKYIEGKLTNGNEGLQDFSILNSKDIEEDDLFIHCFPNGMLTANCYLLWSRGEGVLIDAGNNSDMIIDFVRQKAITLKYVIITHAHIDHMLSMDEVKEKTGAAILMHEDEKELLENCLGAMIINKRYVLDEKDKFIKAGELINFGDRTLEVIHTPGHTKGSICLKTKDLVFTGDTLLKGGYAEVDKAYGDNDKLMDSIYNQLMNMSENIRLYPGHGEVTTVGAEKVNKTLKKIVFIESVR